MALTSQYAAQGRIAQVDPIWAEVRREAEEAIRAEPALGGFIFATVLSHDRLEDAVCHRLAQRVRHVVTRLEAERDGERRRVGHRAPADRLRQRVDAGVRRRARRQPVREHRIDERVLAYVRDRKTIMSVDLS